MKRNLLLSSLVLSTLTLTGCSGSLIESKKIDYKSAGRLPSLEIPPDLTTPSRDERYAIPEGNKGSETFSAYNNERSGRVSLGLPEAATPSDKLRIERDGTQRWLVVTGTPDRLWPVVKEFWQTIGFTLAIEMPEAGIMETDWNENRAKLPQDIIRGTIGKALDFMYSTSERDKFRTRLEKGSTPGTTEIYISHRGMAEVYTNEGRSETRWQSRAADPELEAEMLQRMLVRLGVDAERAKTLLVNEQKQEIRASMLKDTGSGSQLAVQEPFDRTWRRVGLALDRVGFTVEDRDRTKGIYYVRYVDPEVDADKKKGEKGFLDKLAFWRSDKTDTRQAAQMRIVVKGTGDTSTVQVQGHDGLADGTETGRKILGLLLEQLK